MEFKAFGKIPRYNRSVIVTEKLDGTNACVVVSDDGERVTAQSRSRIITPESDNYGFARWVAENAEELKKLGPGHHFGEWWGQGIQRRYCMDRKVFSLFNTGRWTDPSRPPCCDVVPVLWTGPAYALDVYEILAGLRESGSLAALRYDVKFDRPEGIIIYHVAAGKYFKMTLDNDEAKGANDGV